MATLPSRAPDADSGVELHIVSGKGGTGKSTVAAALALALATSGRRVLLCEAEGRQGIAPLFDLAPLPYAETHIASGLPDADGNSGEVWALHIDPESALWEYLDLYYRLGRAGKALDRFGVIEFATTLAPGVRDVLLTGKVYEAARHERRAKHTARYDAVVLDAPPTGRIPAFLNVNSELAGLARMGPIKAQADKVMTLLRAETTAVHLVTLLEEMPVQETKDGVAALAEIGLRVGVLVANRVHTSALTDEQLGDLLDGSTSHEQIAPVLTNVGIPASAAPALVIEGREHAVRRRLEAEQRAILSDLGPRVHELPRLADGVDAEGLRILARRLQQVMGERESA